MRRSVLRDDLAVAEDLPRESDPRRRLYSDLRPTSGNTFAGGLPWGTLCGVVSAHRAVFLAQPVSSLFQSEVRRGGQRLIEHVYVAICFHVAVRTGELSAIMNVRTCSRRVGSAGQRESQGAAAYAGISDGVGVENVACRYWANSAASNPLGQLDV